MIFAAGQGATKRMHRGCMKSAANKLREESTESSKAYQVSFFWAFPRRQETRYLKTLSKRAVNGLGIERDLGMSAKPARSGEEQPEQRLQQRRCAEEMK